MSDTSATIIAGLREISWLLSLKNEDFFRSRAYGKAADALAKYEGDLGALIDSGQISELAGVGNRTAKVVGELHQTGRSHLLSQLRQDFPREVGRLARIPGLGLSRLQTLHKALGIETLQDLRDACASKAIAGVRGFGPAIIAKIEKSLTAFDDAPARILLPHARELAGKLIELWSPLVQVTLQITGDLRRRREAVDRIELIAASDRPTLPELPMVGDLAPAAYESEFDALTKLRVWQGILREGIGVRVWLAPPQAFGAALLATTGPDRFTRVALPRAQVFDDEAALIRSAELPAWPPEVRDMFAEGESAPNLVERPQLRGLVHAHTTDSDGRNDLRTMAREAKALGYSYLTITDHSPSARYAHGVSLEDLARQGDMIRTVEQEEGIRILRGTESDIQAEGGLDHPIEVLEQLDIVIASIHGRFRLDADRMTDRLVKTFDLPIRMVWGHPLGRLVLSRAPIEADLDRVLDKIADRGHILEVNGDPHRMDLPPRWIREAKKRGIPFVLSADAHSVRGLRMAETAVDCARAGGLSPTEVLNTQDSAAFEAAVRPRS